MPAAEDNDKELKPNVVSTLWTPKKYFLPVKRELSGSAIISRQIKLDFNTPDKYHAKNNEK